MYDFNWLGLSVFAFVLLATPGPAVISLFYSGINYGFVKSLPYFFGVLLGFVFNLALCAFGAGVILEFSTAYTGLKILMLGYILYLAYKIATSAPLDADGEVQPLHFWQGVLLNVLNPKAYIAAMSSISQFSLVSNYWESTLWIVAINFMMAFVFQGMWCYCGQFVQLLFSHPKWFRRINIALAALLVMSVAYAYLN